MLKVYAVAREVCGEVAVVAGEVERRDGDLARQMRRAVASVALNLAEGSGSQGRNRNARYFNALGSAREVLACLEVAEAMRYVEGEQAELRGRLNRVVGTLVRVLRPR